jgi:class 3 adenylate cyclase/tetratricopeptide (TPR) repeat protein
MTFEEILDQAIAMLQRRGRLTYSILKRQFQLDEDALNDLKDALLFAHPQVHDEAGRGLVWGGDLGTTPLAGSSPARPQDRAPLAYTPPYLAEKILTARHALEGERKQVTVLFADLKGSTELIADLDPEAARQLLDPALHHMMEAVHRYEGTVNQVLGDGIMALFGAPVAHEDHAARACYAALAMQAAMRRYAEEVRHSHGLEMQARVGLNSGEVVVRSIGNDLHMDYSAVGQTTHLAARMEQLAPPGSIRLTAATLRLAEGLVQVNALGQFPVRGVTEPVEVFELVGASAIRRRLQASAARGLTRFVGRQQEMAALQQALEQARTAHGQVVALVGEAGVGKSRLVYEFVHSHHTPGWLVLESASVSYGKATPYFPVIDLLKRYCHIEERDAPRTIRAKVTGQLLTLDEALHATIPAVLALLDALPADSPFLTLDPPQRRQHTLDGLKHLLLRESQVQPLLLVFEDLHWIDTETQTLLDSLVESVPTARLLLLVNYRPEYQHGWGSKTYYRQLRLDPLPPTSADEFLQALLGNDSSLAPLKPLLIARTGGNPFFLEESVRTLVETGMLVGAPGAYRLPKTLASLQMPATVQAVLAARIDRLPLEEKHLLQTAAVIGTEVPWPLLQAIADLPEAALYHGLAHLQAAEFLYETRLFPERAFTFKHALTHEVAYSSLLQERRRVLHSRIVEALETLSAERVAEQVERLAHHALRGAVWDKAMAYCRQAAARAMARSAQLEAVGYVEQALGTLAHLPESRTQLEQAFDLRLELRHALWPLGQFRKILEILQEADALAARLDDPRRLGHVAVYLCVSFYGAAQHHAAVAAGERALALSLATGDSQLQVLAHVYLGQALVARTDYARGIEYLRKAVASLEGELRLERLGQGTLPAVLARATLVRGLVELGRFAESIACGEEALQIAERVNHPASLMLACWGGALPYLRQGNVARAIPLLQRGVQICRERELPTYYHWVGPPLGAAYVLAGQTREAVQLLEGAIAQDLTLNILSQHSLTAVHLAEAYLRAGQLDEAYTQAQYALEFSRAHQERGYEAYALRLLGEIAVHHKPPDVESAAVFYHQALALAEELGMRPLQAHCHLGLGTLYARSGQQQAHIALATAIALYRTMDMTLWLPQAQAALAQVASQ